MHRQILKTTLLFLTLLISHPASAKTFKKSKDAILLSNVRSLTLHGDRQTSHRRIPAIPQLTCTGGNARGLYNVDVMRCQNTGSEYDPQDIQWTCKASLPPEFKLGSTEVVCEGYDSPEDDFVLKGSCGVEYRLVLTEAGEARFGKGSGGSWFGQGGDDDAFGIGKGLTGVWKVLFWVVFFIVLYTILEKIYSAWVGNGNGRGRGPRLGGGWGGGGGGDDGGDNDPPPPYSRRPPSSKRSNYSSSSRGGPSWMGGGNGNQWQPGFWTGLATGAGAGYMMGNRNGSSSNRPPRSYDAGGGFGGGARDSWGGGGGGSGSSAFAGPSSSRHESTGFGGTRRR